MATEQEIFQRSELLLGAEGKGSLVHITAIFGFMLASLVIQDIVK